MPIIAKGSKKGKRGKSGSKKKAVKLVPDPDAAYKEQLDETLYLSKPSRTRLMRHYASAVDAAIETNLVSVNTISAGVFHIPSRIQMIKIPDILRSLGLCVTDEQIDQICCMVSQVAPPSGSQTEVAGGEAEAPESPESPESFAETEKVRQVLSEMLHTGVLAYDSQVLSHPDPGFPVRASSVVYKVVERDIASCFESIWDATGRKSVTQNDGTRLRCFTVDELETVMAEVQRDISSVEPLTAKELDKLYFFVKGESSDVIGEDTFLRCFAEVE